MNFYQELTLLPQDEINIHLLWSKIFQQIHLGLVEITDNHHQTPIGVSFPEYVTGNKFSTLGSKCRLFSPDETTLTRFDTTKWLARLTDYVHCTSIRPVPGEVASYSCYQRYQSKTNPLRLARRYASRHGMDLETAFYGQIQLKPADNSAQRPMFRYCDFPKRQVCLPFIRLNSLSSEHSFCLWIKKVHDKSTNPGVFSTYGLSATVTVPEF